MGISLGSVRVAAKQIAQNTPTTGSLGVNLLLTDPDDFNVAVVQALQLFDSDRPNVRTVDHTVAVAGFRPILKGTGALAELTGADAWPGTNLPKAVWYPWDVTSQGQEALDPNHYRIVQDPGPLTILELLIDSLVVGQVLRLQFTRPHGLTEAPNSVAAPTTAPSAVLATPAAPGNVDNGAHSYAVTYVTAHGETPPSAASSPVTVADKSVNGQVTVTIQVSPDYGVTARKVYRTVAGDAGTRKLVGTVANNTATSFTDDIADSGLGADVPSTNTAGGVNTVDDDDEEKLHLLGASMILQLAANKAVQNTGNTNLPNDIVDRRTQSDIYRSRAKELRDLYNSLVGRGKDADLSGHSAFGDMDTEMSDGRGFLWHGGR